MEEFFKQIYINLGKKIFVVSFIFCQFFSFICPPVSFASSPGNFISLLVSFVHPSVRFVGLQVSFVPCPAVLLVPVRIVHLLLVFQLCFIFSESFFWHPMSFVRLQVSFVSFPTNFISSPVWVVRCQLVAFVSQQLPVTLPVSLVLQ